MNANDERRDRLAAGFPGWRIWYVPGAVTRVTTWHASPRRYPLDAYSADDLADLIGADPLAQAGDPAP